MDTATTSTAPAPVQEQQNVDSTVGESQMPAENIDNNNNDNINTDGGPEETNIDPVIADEEQKDETTEIGTTPHEEETAVHNNENGNTHRERSHKHIDSSDEDELDDNIMRKHPDVQADDEDNRPKQTSRQVLEEKLDLLLKKPKVKRTRRDEDDLEQFLDEKILRLKDEMNIAAQLDIDTLNKRIETNDKSLIAIQKVKLLPKVESILSKANLADTILDNNLLQSVRIWLEPLPDGSLPSFEIQKSLFTAISDLPIKTEHLKESGLGRIMIFYTKSKRVEPQLGRLAERLIAEWTRPIIGASDNYRDKRITQLEFDSEKLRKKSALNSAKRKKKRTDQASVTPASSSSTTEEQNGSNAQSLYEQAAARRGRAAAPAQTTTDYKYAPVSNIMAMNTNARTTGVGSTLNNSELYKRLNSKLNKKK